MSNNALPTSQCISNFSITDDFGGPFVTPINETIYVSRYGNLVIISIPAIVAAANSSSDIAFGSSLPTQFRPTVDKFQNFAVLDNSTNIVGQAKVDTGGVIRFFAGLNGDFFSNTGNAGLGDTQIFYYKES